jgi:hypothetical protein
LVVIYYLNDATYTHDIICRVAVAKATFKGITLFYQQIGLKFKEEISEMLRLEHGFVCC